MKSLLCTLALALALQQSATAQSSDADLTFTLPTGKVITFQDPDQKARFLAARDRLHQVAPAPSAAPSAQPAHQASVLDHAASDDKTSSGGKVNVSSPTFTADYYMFAPETWVGKQATVSVAYLTANQGAVRKDGMREFEAHTYGILQRNGDQHSGGYMTILATPAAADRILTLCGTRLQYLGWNYKMTLIKGQFALVSGAEGGAKQYGLMVTQ